MEMYKAEMQWSINSRKKKKENSVIFSVAFSQFSPLIIETLSASLVQ